MFTFKKPFTKRITVDVNRETAATLFQQSLKVIGGFTGSDETDGGVLILKGLSSYGLQSVPLMIWLEKINDSETAVTIEGRSDDVYAAGAKKCIERLLTVFDNLRNGTTGDSAFFSRTSFFQKTGVSKPMLILIVFVFACALMFMMALL